MLNEKYSINVKAQEKEIDMVIRGSFTKEDVMSFVTDYNQSLQPIDPKDFILNVDCTTMNIITQDMIPDLENSFSLYGQAHFKKIVFIIVKSPVIKMQLNRVAKHAGLNNFDFVQK
ncbi:MAG: hypothetical protein ACE3JK_15330 [Sporolactobacillus sp.]